MRRRVLGVVGWLAVTAASIAPASSGWAASPRAAVREGNAAYAAGKYDEALSAYAKAGVDAPESPEIYFNQGGAYYRKEDYAKATECFEKASLKSRGPALESRSQFNLGNCAFREAGRQKDSDLRKAIGSCERSIRFYQRALELDPTFRDAAENIEVVRLVMKTILDELKKQQEQAQQQQSAQQQAAEQLKNLLEKQEALAAQTRAVNDERMRKGDSQELQKKMDSQASEQKQLREGTAKVAEDLDRQQPQPEAAQKAREHLQAATGAQAASAEKLTQHDTAGAMPEQGKAVEEMKKALESLSGQGQQPQPQAGGQDPQKQDEQKKREDQQRAGEEPESQEGQEQPDDQKQEELAAMPDEAQDILDEEKRNKDEREQVREGGYRAVDKDW